MPNVLSPRDRVSRADNMDETVPHIIVTHAQKSCGDGRVATGEAIGPSSNKQSHMNT